MRILGRYLMEATKTASSVWASGLHVPLVTKLLWKSKIIDILKDNSFYNGAKRNNSEYTKLGISRIRTNFKEGKICFIKTPKVKTAPQPAEAAELGFAADSYARLQLSDGQSSVIQRLLLHLPLRLGSSSQDMLLIKGQRRKCSLRNCKMTQCCSYRVLWSTCPRDSPWGCCATTKEEEKDSICCSLVFQKVHMPV